VVNYVDTLETLLGSYVDEDAYAALESADTVPETMFGLLGKLYAIKTDASSAKNNAAAAMTAAEAVRRELGAEGMSDTTYGKVEVLEDALQELKTAAKTISESQVETGTVATEILDSLSNYVNQSASALGIGGDSDGGGGGGGGGGAYVDSLTGAEANDPEKVFEKLDEINAKLNALKEAVEVDDVVVKTWFESEG